MDPERHVGVRIAAIRKRRGLTQEDLAALIGRSVNSVSSIERGKHWPGFDTLRRLASALDVPMRDFLAPGGDGGEADSPRHAALFAEMLDGARTLPPADLELGARIFGLIVARYGR